MREKGYDYFPRISRGDAVQLDQVRFPSHNLIREFCEKTTEILDMSLFGLDLVTETGTNTHYLVDLNYFPSYRGIESRYQKILDFLIAKTQGKSRQ